MKVYWDPAQLAHAPRFFLQRGVVRPNFEIPARAEALLEGVRSLGLTPSLPPPTDRAALAAVHTHAYLDFLQTAPAAWDTLPGHGPELVPNVHPTPEMLANGARPGSSVVGQLGWFTADTSSPFTAETWPAAQAAAACAIAAADQAAAGRDAYALARPPGHHAYAARAGGHCFLNNAAIAAERLRARGAARVAILDIDSHHGNGTQAIFWERADVLFVSLHGDPNHYYPWFVGHPEERGAGAGLDHNLNLPLPRGATDTLWLEALTHALRTVEAFDPDALVLSLGFDASQNEPLGFMQVTPDGFTQAARQIAALRRPTAIIQEGGYNTDEIGSLLKRTLAEFGPTR